jgi:hypothetical protein
MRWRMSAIVILLLIPVLVCFAIGVAAVWRTGMLLWLGFPLVLGRCLLVGPHLSPSAAATASVGRGRNAALDRP